MSIANMTIMCTKMSFVNKAVILGETNYIFDIGYDW